MTTLTRAYERMALEEAHSRVVGDGFYGTNAWLIKGVAPHWFRQTASDEIGWTDAPPVEMLDKGKLTEMVIGKALAADHREVKLGPVVPGPNVGALWACHVLGEDGWYVNANFVLGVEATWPGVWRWAEEGLRVPHLLRFNGPDLVGLIAPLERVTA